MAEQPHRTGAVSSKFQGQCRLRGVTQLAPDQAALSGIWWFPLTQVPTRGVARLTKTGVEVGALGRWAGFGEVEKETG